MINPDDLGAYYLVGLNNRIIGRCEALNLQHAFDIFNCTHDLGGLNLSCWIVRSYDYNHAIESAIEEAF